MRLSFSVQRVFGLRFPHAHELYASHAYMLRIMHARGQSAEGLSPEKDNLTLICLLSRGDGNMRPST